MLILDVNEHASPRLAARPGDWTMSIAYSPRYLLVYRDVSCYVVTCTFLPRVFFPTFIPTFRSDETEISLDISYMVYACISLLFVSSNSDLSSEQKEVFCYQLNILLTYSVGNWIVMIKVYRNLNSIMYKTTALLEKNYGTAQIAPLQKAALKEYCILVDKLDRPVGEATKQACHEIDAEGYLPLHRAFSVFLFNGKGDLLIHKRSSVKVTFPNYYTNTCCSHPLANIPNEKEEEDAIGIRRAAIRRLSYELGIPSSEIKPSDLFYLTRIYYKLPSDDRWGEHEIDYILFLQRDNIIINPNPDEVSEIRWVSRSEIDNFVKTTSLLTPWFRMLYKFKLLHWWDNLQDLTKVQDHQSITLLKD